MRGAIQADILVSNSAGHGETLLLDAIPLSLGLENMGGTAETPAPVISPLFKDGQTAPIHDGVNELAGLRWRFALRGIPARWQGIFA